VSISISPVLIGSILLLFEVMDKERPLAQTALLYGVLSVIGCLLSSKRWWLGALVLPVVGLFAWVDIGELRDPFVGPEIVREAGSLYVLLWYAFILAGFGVPIVTAAIMRHGSLRKKATVNELRRGSC
jgi:hypothetical protein